MSSYRLAGVATLVACLVVILNHVFPPDHLGKPVPQPGATNIERLARVEPEVFVIGFAVALIAVIAWMVNYLLRCGRMA